jgi:hypothetical protein
MRIVMRFVSIITALLCASSGAMGQQPSPSGPSERLTWSMNASQAKGGWKFGYEHEIPHQYSIDELIHNDDNIDSWRELVTVENFRRPQGASAEDVFDRLRSNREKSCPAGIMQWTVIDKSTDSFVYEVIRTQPCRGFAPERELGRIVFGKFNYFRLRYDAKGTAWEPGQREEWLKSISEAKIASF